MEPARKRHPARSGIGQLTLVEHALCPLDARQSALENLVHSTSYRFTDANRKRRSAKVRVFCPLGLSAGDELYLWGLLALTMTHGVDDAELRATPHWCLRRLNLIDTQGRRGGRQYKQFEASLRRLSAVKYLCDNFYDPVRREHRRVSFGFLSFSLPQDPNSSRAWRIAWDPLFFEAANAAAGQFRFDLECYRSLDTASRRLFLFACKVFARRTELPPMELIELGTNLLGFAPTLSVRNMKVKVGRCIERLRKIGVVQEGMIQKTRPGEYRICLTRGAYFDKVRGGTVHAAMRDDPLCDSLVGVGFDMHAASRLVRRYPRRVLAEWVDITQAALERFGPSFFRKSPMAYLVDSVTKAAKGNRTPPDWWRELRREESRGQDESKEAMAVFSRLQSEVFGGPAKDAVKVSERHGFTSVRSVLQGDEKKQLL
ncbi:MAG: hypothetical protein J5J06_19885 [Phycisphaerae bacterium]|nr:hypothetical protein [Phycisphaerae bacterium]